MINHKLICALPLLGTAVLMTACGRSDEYDRFDHAVAPETRVTAVMTDRPNHSRTGRDAANLASDIIDEGVEIASDVVQGGREIASDVNAAVEDAVDGDLLDTDANDNYRAGSDGKTNLQTTTRTR